MVLRCELELRNYPTQALLTITRMDLIKLIKTVQYLITITVLYSTNVHSAGEPSTKVLNNKNVSMKNNF